MDTHKSLILADYLALCSLVARVKRESSVVRSLLSMGVKQYRVPEKEQVSTRRGFGGIALGWLPHTCQVGSVQLLSS